MVVLLELEIASLALGRVLLSVRACRADILFRTPRQGERCFIPGDHSATAIGQIPISNTTLSIRHPESKDCEQDTCNQQSQSCEQLHSQIICASSISEKLSSYRARGQGGEREDRDADSYLEVRLGSWKPHDLGKSLTVPPSNDFWSWSQQGQAWGVDCLDCSGQ